MITDLRGSQRQNNWLSYSVMGFFIRSQLDKWTVEVLTHNEQPFILWEWKAMGAIMLGPFSIVILFSE